MLRRFIKKSLGNIPNYLLVKMYNVNVDRNAALCYNYKKFIMHIFS